MKKAGDQAEAEQERQRRADAAIASFASKTKELATREAKIEKREKEVQEDLNQARKIKEDFGALFTN